MSFEVFVSSYCEGKDAGIPRERVVEAFGGALRLSATRRWDVGYDPANRCELYVSLDPDNPEAILGFMVSRPCADRRLWESLFGVMRLGHVVLYYPGCSAAMVASDHAARHLPVGMADDLGGVACVRSGQEIVERIRSG